MVGRLCDLTVTRHDLFPFLIMLDVRPSCGQTLSYTDIFCRPDIPPTYPPCCPTQVPLWIDRPYEERKYKDMLYISNVWHMTSILMMLGGAIESTPAFWVRSDARQMVDVWFLSTTTTPFGVNHNLGLCLLCSYSCSLVDHSLRRQGGAIYNNLEARKEKVYRDSRGKCQ